MAVHVLSQSIDDPGFELVVVDGPLARTSFALLADEIEIGRGEEAGTEPSAVRIPDPSISSRQAVLRRQAEGDYLLEHVAAATNPTIVNGRAVLSRVLHPGDRIQLGHVHLELRARGADEAIEMSISPERTVLVRREDPQISDDPDATTVSRGIRGYLIIVRGTATRPGTRFPLVEDQVRIGRAEGSDIHLDEKAVSRLHAELVFEGERVRILHRSRTNPTRVNGVRVDGSASLEHGDIVQLAEDVELRLELAGAARATPGRKARSRLLDKLQQKVDLEQEIESEFVRYGSFLDVDVVGSYSMKSGGVGAAEVAISFERFRDYVAHKAAEAQGDVFNSNGDEVMCFFPEPTHAVAGGIAMLRDLEAFNQAENLLPSPFQLRIGVHTGRCTVDLEEGRAYSQVLDIAGHLQKEAQTNGLLISQTTLEAVGERADFEAAGSLAREGIPVHRWTDSGG